MGSGASITLYDVVRGKPPKFSDGNVQAFTGLYFNLETEAFNFYQCDRGPTLQSCSEKPLSAIADVKQNPTARSMSPGLLQSLHAGCAVRLDVF